MEMFTLIQTAVLMVLTAQFAATGALRRRVIGEPGALCNDFSPALYYIHHNPSTSPGWVVHFEGGGGCSSFEECNQRWRDMTQRRLMSSDNFPQDIVGNDILSNDSTENPLFHNYSHVLVPYCSSDAWLANRSNPDKMSIAEFSEERDADNFVYKGRVIFQAVFEELLQDYNLSNASELVLVGSSAGGIGVLNNLDWVEDRLRNASARNVRILTIIDSSWFIPFSGYHAVNWSEGQARAFGINQPACMDRSLGFPCCTSPACLFRNKHLRPSHFPIFAISSIYDIFTLERPLRDNIQTSEANDLDLLRLLNSYGALMNQSFIEGYNTYPNLTLYTSSCTQHVYLATSSLWDPDGTLNATNNGSFQEGVFRLTNPIKSGNWDRVKVVSQNATTLTLHAALQIWYDNPTARFYLADNCSGPVCGRRCPSTIVLEPPRNIWTTGVNILVLLLSAFLTIIPASLKLGAYLHMKCMLYQQRIYAYSVKQATRNKPHFPKAVHPVSVSCTELHYRIDVVNRPKVAKKGEYPHSSEQYRTYAMLETFFPCFKRLCSKCLMKRNAPVCDSSTSRHLNSLETQRSDSGVPSSITLDMSSQTVTPHSESSGSSGEGMDTRSLVSSQGDTNGDNIKKKTILDHVNMYVNPGELVAVMGPSGSGKTTLLDVLLGRRTAGSTEGDVFINGIPLSKMRDWFVTNTGYVRQLATSYYDELTVRENLLFSMNMQASPGMRLSQKLERVEQVIRETGLLEQADIRVGNGTGLGLSGGQRKRLAIAVQLLSMPNIIFLDEPTSGLDSASSLEILKSLQVLAATGRAIVVTIHQPRSEIFHAFDKILLLCKGQVAFFGSPFRVWDFFLEVLEEHLSDTELKENEGKSRADAILDLLKERHLQRKVLHAYRHSTEPKKVRAAVISGIDENDSPPSHVHSRYPGFWSRLVSMESRASLRQGLFSTIYLPIVYVVFGTILGTTYLFTDFAVQIMSVTCLLSCSSSLFMSSIVMSLLIEPLKLFRLEHSDGIACAHELILQVFIRMTAVCTLPLAICATLVFGLVFQNYDLWVYLTVLLAFLLVNQAWISLFIVLTVTYPQQAHRMCPVFAAIGGFCCGFIVPMPLMPEYYRWIFRINPSYYAYAATTVVVLDGNNLGCTRDSPLECFRESGVAVLARFGLDDVNPIFNLVVLMGMIVVFVVLGILILQLKVTFPLVKESLMNVCCFITAWRKKKRRVHSSWETLEQGGRESNPITLRSIRPFFEGTDSKRDPRYSTAFLEQGEHLVFHTFPWERPTDVTEATDGECTVPLGALTTPNRSERRRIRDQAGGGEKFCLDSEIIDMEERDEEERRRVAQWKWEQRRQKMEAEFSRLKHFSRTVDRVQHQHNFMFCGDEHDHHQLQNKATNQRRSSQSNLYHSLTHASLTPQVPRHTRSFSVPHQGRTKRTHSLETHHEEEEEEETIMVGLPPKDVPNVGESMENLDRLVINDIPEEDVNFEEWNISDNEQV